MRVNKYKNIIRTSKILNKFKRGFTSLRSVVTRQGGFTLIEMLVVVGIVILLSLGAIIAVGTSSNQKRLDSAADQVQSALYEALSLSYAPYNPNNDCVYAYGIRTKYEDDERKYIIFSDMAISGFLEGDKSFIDGTDQIIREFTLPRGVKFENQNMDVVFTLPEQDIDQGIGYQQQTFVDGFSADGEIVLKAGEDQKTVKILNISNYFYIEGNE